MAWLLIVAVALSLSALAIIDPDQALMGRYYPSPAANAQPPAEIVYSANELRKGVTNETRDKSELDIAIPLRESGVATGYAVIPVAVKAVIEGPNGARWESPWNVIYNERYLPGTLDATVRFRIRRSIFDRFKASPVNLRLTFAIDQARAAAQTSISLSYSEFAVPSFGICTPQSTRFNVPPEITGINCRSAMHPPRLTYVTARWSEGPCSERDANGESLLGTAWEGSFDTDPAEFGITSVWETPLNLSNSWAGYNKGYVRPRRLCPGSPVTFTRYELVGHTQIEIAIPSFRLPEIALGDQYRFLMK
jgi:hypothetical protein